MAAYFDNSDFSDVQVVISLGPGSKRKRDDAASDDAARRIHCHQFVLIVGSPKLNKRLKNWEPRPASAGASGEPQQLVIDVASAEEAQAVESLIEFLYSRGLPADANPLQLLQLMITSNEYQSTLCTQACARHLEGLNDHSFSPELLLAVFQLPPFLLEAPEFQGVVRRASMKLEEIFLDLEAAWRQEELRELLLELPAAAFKALLRLDTLAVVSENTVLLALLCWLERQPQEVSADLRADLMSFIRLQHLTPAYRTYVLPHCPYVKECVPQQRLLAAQALSQYSDEERALIFQDLNDRSSSSPLQVPPRSGTSSGALSCQLTVSLDQLEKGQEKVQHALAASDKAAETLHGLPSLHYNGFRLRPYLLHTVSSSSPSQPELCFMVDVDIPSSKDAILEPPVLLRASFRAFRPGSCRTGTMTGISNEVADSGMILETGFTDFFGLLNHPPNTLASFAQDGQVTVEFEVQSCR